MSRNTQARGIDSTDRRPIERKPGIAAVHVVHPDAGTCHALQSLLDAAGYAVTLYTSADAFLGAARSLGGCALIGLRLPGLSGLKLQARLRDAGSDLGVIFITRHGTVSAAVRAMRAGAVDFLTHPLDEERLLERVGQAISDYERRRETVAQMAEIRHRLETLSARERQVMRYVVAGYSNKQIAREIDISYRTVELHRIQAMDKMAADSIAALVRQCLRAREPIAKLS